jgi:hypothetical protein
MVSPSSVVHERRSIGVKIFNQIVDVSCPSSEFLRHGAV